MVKKVDVISAINVSYAECTIKNNVVDLSIQRYSVFPKVTASVAIQIYTAKHMTLEFEAEGSVNAGSRQNSGT